MIKVGFGYMIFSPKPTTKGTMFRLMDSDKKSNTKNYVTVFTDQKLDLYDRQKVTIKSIESVNIGEYNNKVQVSMNATVSVGGSAEEIKKEFGITKENEIDIQSDDLPL